MSVDSHPCSVSCQIPTVGSLVVTWSLVVPRGGWDVLSAVGLGLDLSLLYLCLNLWPERYFCITYKFSLCQPVSVST